MDAESAGPLGLGRGVIVAADRPAPAGWANAPRVEIDAAALEDPAPAVSALHGSWAGREPVVVSLGVDPAAFRDPVAIAGPVHRHDPGLDLPLDRLHHLVWANNYDAREGELVWWWAVKAVRAGLGEGGDADVLLADGSPAWVDGGPRWSVPELPVAVVHFESVELGRPEAVPGGGDPSSAGLAPDQLAAVSHRGGPVRVIAPAGSGKTRVLTERMRHLLADRGYGREKVIAVAYNRLAQQQLEERLAGLEPRTRTLNSLGYSLLARHRRTRPPVMSEPDVRSVIDDVFPIPRRRLANTDPVGPYLDGLTLVRLGLRGPAEVEASRDDVPGLADGFEPFRARLRELGAVDFDEQIYGTLEALLGDGEFRRRVQAEHRHMLVDEFQDLTPAHVLMIRLLAMPGFDVFGVGDDDQTIYDHAGADPRFLVDYRSYFSGAGATALEVNYRSAVPIVDAARNLLSYNRVRVEKEVRAADGAAEDDAALRIEAHAGGRAGEAVVDAVRSWTGEGADPESIAVLARVNSLLLAPQIALWAAGVPVRSAVHPDVLERTGTAAALAWIRVALDPADLLANDLELIRRRPSRGFPQWISKWLRNCRSVHDLRGIQRKIDDPRVATRVGEMAEDIDLLAAEAAGGAGARRLLEIIRDRIGLGSAMEMLDGSKGSEATASHLDDLEALMQVADLHDDPGEFEPWLRAALVESSGERGVTLATVHRVKGREWDDVAVFGVSDGLMPHRLSESWEAERRVMHVAITRARSRCLVLGDAGRRSPFLDELTGAAESPAVRPAPTVAELRPRSRPGTRHPAVGLDSTDAAPEAVAADRALREWRTERARADRVPPYVVLSNRHLEGIAARMPADLVELNACEGIGPAKLERYGDDILAVLESVRG